MTPSEDKERQKRIRLLELEIDGQRRRNERLKENPRHRSPAHVTMELARGRGRLRKLQEELQELKNG